MEGYVVRVNFADGTHGYLQCTDGAYGRCYPMTAEIEHADVFSASDMWIAEEGASVWRTAEIEQRRYCAEHKWTHRSFTVEIIAAT